MIERETDESGRPLPSSVDLDGDPAYVHVCERQTEPEGSMVALVLLQNMGRCSMDEVHYTRVCHNLDSSEARKLAAALLNAADALDGIEAE